MGGEIKNLRGTVLQKQDPPPLYKSLLVFLRAFFSNLYNIYLGAKFEYTRSRGGKPPHIGTIGISDPIARLRKDNREIYGEEVGDEPEIEEDLPQTILYKTESGELFSDALMRQVRTDKHGRAVLPNGEPINMAQRVTTAVSGSLEELDKYLERFEMSWQEGADYTPEEINEYKLYKKQADIERGKRYTV